MGRKLGPIKDNGPKGDFAQLLRNRRDQAPVKLTYRRMADQDACFFSHAVLADAAAGATFPTWPVTEAFVRACGADDTEVKQWQQTWRDHDHQLHNLQAQYGTTSIPLGQGLRTVPSGLADVEDCTPRPEQVHTFEDLRYQLQLLKINGGNPSLRTLSKRMRNHGYGFSTSTLHEALTGKGNRKNAGTAPRNPSYELTTSLVDVLLTGCDAGEAAWGERRAWAQAWTRAQVNHDKLHLTRPRPTGRLAVVTTGPTRSLTSDAIATMTPQDAAPLLAALPDEDRGRILRHLIDTTHAAKIMQALDNMPPDHTSTA